MPHPLSSIDSEQSGPPIPGLIGSGRAMEAVYRLTRRVARSNASVLLQGETGTGKELIAKAIHRLSPRGSGPFVRVNCGALAENLLESELFGHVRGAFTGAVDNRTGRFEAAHTGTIFLDEIDSTSPKLQVKLLRVLQEHEFERVGDARTVAVDTRVIAASNRDLLAESEAGRFREDLYYRLNVVTIRLPPLAERREDIPALVEHFLRIYAAENSRDTPRIDPAALGALCDYPWPGNVRELQNYIERAVVLAPRDVVSRAIVDQMERTRHPNVYLDLTHLDPDKIRSRFPNIYKHCLKQGYDLVKEPIPVTPAQHYFMGGIEVDLKGRTSMEKLYAIGETSCTGVHGKNRLGSNSLLESLVFAKRAAAEIAQSIPYTPVEETTVDLSLYENRVFDSEFRNIVLDEIRRRDKDFYEQWIDTDHHSG